jgi:2-polyprenyl-3-methyl-5-hydroxy-6-metoxy-1,4-benzoquinol methylase
MVFQNFPEQCPLCLSRTTLLNSNHPGYQQPETFSIYTCANCDTQFAYPMSVNEKIYNIIYESADDIRGYSRYVNFANLILTKRDPLGFLARAEEPYWFISDYLESRRVPKDASILEIGSGLGYLTYSISKRGYSRAMGMDISENAVESAKQRYGDLYFAGDLMRYSAETSVRYDIIVITEVIEHITNIFEIIRSMKAILKQDGVILLTTPNKSAHKINAYWKTDNPPIHLWWFSESSLRQIAIREKLQVEFWDFSGFHGQRVLGITREAESAIVPIMSPYIDAEGNILAHPHFVPANRPIHDAIERIIGEQRLSHIKRLIQKPANSLRFYKGRGVWAATRSGTMGVVLKAESISVQR